MQNKRKCMQCGTDIAKGTVFCTKCGTRVNEEEVVTAKKKVSAKKNIALIGIVASLVAILVLVVVFVVVPFLQPHNRTMRAIRANNYERAVRIYKDSVKGGDKYRDFINEYEDYLEVSKENYFNEKLTYDEMCIILSHVSDFNISKLNELAPEIQGYVDIIHQSRTNWSVAEELFANKSYPEAMEYYAQVDAIDSYFDAARTKYNECIELYRNMMLERAEAYAVEQEYFSALNVINEALVVLKEDSQLIAKQSLYTTQAEEKSVSDAIAEATELYDSESYAEAMGVLELIMKTNSNAELTNLYNKCVAAFEVQEIESACSEVEELYQQELFEKAIVVLNEAMKKYSSSELTELYDKCISARNKQAIKEAEDYAAEHYNAHEYEQVFSMLDSYLKTYASHSDVVEAITDIRNTYATTVRTEYLNKAKEVFKASGYKAAVDVISEGLAVLTNDSELTDAYNGYMEYKPVSLLDLDYFNAKENSSISTPRDVQDNVGNNQVGSFTFLCPVNSANMWIEYLVDRKYTQLSGVFFLEYDARTTTENVTIQIFGDDVLLYTASLTGGVKPISFEVDITNVQTLKFVYKTFWDNKGFTLPYEAGRFVDVFLSK